MLIRLIFPKNTFLGLILRESSTFTNTIPFQPVIRRLPDDPTIQIPRFGCEPWVPDELGTSIHSGARSPPCHIVFGCSDSMQNEIRQRLRMEHVITICLIICLTDRFLGLRNYLVRRFCLAFKGERHGARVTWGGFGKEWLNISIGVSSNKLLVNAPRKLMLNYC